MDLKRCSKCGEEKPLEGFGKNARNEDGLQRMCRPCCGAIHSAWREANRERLREEGRARRRTDPEKARAADRRRRESHKSELRAYWKAWDIANPKARMVASAKQRAKRSGLPFDLSTDDFDIPDRCPALGIPLEKGGDNRWAWPSLDKIVPELGYTRSNVIVVSLLANSVKTLATPTQVLAVGQFYRDLELHRSADAETRH